MSEFDSHPKCTHLLPTGKELIWSFKFVKDARKELILTSLTEWYKILWILKTAPGAFNFPPRCKRWERCCVYDVFTVCVNSENTVEPQDMSVIRSRTELITRGARILDHFFLITNNRKKKCNLFRPSEKKNVFTFEVTSGLLRVISHLASASVNVHVSWIFACILRFYCM